MSDDLPTVGEGTTPPVEYTPMEGTISSMGDEEKKKNYHHDTDGLKEAAADLTDSRTQAANDEPRVRVYQRLGDGEPVPPNQTVSAETAAADLDILRTIESAENTPYPEDLASAVDFLRVHSGNYAAQAQQPEPQPQQQQQAEPAQQQQQPGLDPDTQDAIRTIQSNPKIMAALQETVQQTEATRAAYAAQVQQSTQLAAASFLSSFPELMGLSPAELPTAVAVIAKQDPARGAAILAHVDRVQRLNNMSQQAQAHQAQLQQARLHEERARLNAFVRAEDAKFEAEVASKESPETMRRLAENVVDMAQEYGVSKAELAAIWHSQPLVRSSAFQRMAVDAARWRMAQKEIAGKLSRDLPPVQRPGTSQPRQGADEYRVRSLQQQLDRSGSYKDAAALILARRGR
jgi:hypothetical protein